MKIFNILLARDPALLPKLGKLLPELVELIPSKANPQTVAKAGSGSSPKNPRGTPI